MKARTPDPIVEGILQIRELKPELKQAELARIFHVSTATISRILNGLHCVPVPKPPKQPKLKMVGPRWRNRQRAAMYRRQVKEKHDFRVTGNLEWLAMLERHRQEEENLENSFKID